jgi:hypothetical protein
VANRSCAGGLVTCETRDRQGREGRTARHSSTIKDWLTLPSEAALAHPGPGHLYPLSSTGASALSNFWRCMKATKRLRKKASDEDADDDGPTILPAASKAAKAAKKKGQQTLGLSFDMDDEGEAFKVEKKKKKTRPVVSEEAPDRATAPESLSAQAGVTSVYTGEWLRKLRSEQAYRAAPDAGDGPIPGDVLPEDNLTDAVGLPDAEAVRVARAQRERARRQAEDGDEGFISLGDGDGAHGAYTKLQRGCTESHDAEGEEDDDDEAGGRMLRDDDFDEDPSVFEGQDGAQLPFGRPLEGRGHGDFLTRGPQAAGVSARGQTEVVQTDEEREAMQGGVEVASTPVDGSETHGATGGAAGSEETIAAHAATLTGGGMVTRTQEKLAVEAARQQQNVSALYRELDETQHKLKEAADACSELEADIQTGLASFEFLQRAQAYAEDLLDCLTEKAPLAEQAEVEYRAALEDRRRALRDAFEWIEAAERARAQAVLRGSWRAPPVARRSRAPSEQAPPPLALDPGGDVGSALAALEAQEARRARRRRGSRSDDGGDGGGIAWEEEVVDGEVEGGEDESDGEGSDEAASAFAEDPGTAAHLAASAAARRAHRVQQAAIGILSDTAPEFSEVRLVRKRFMQWRSAHPR